MNETVYIGLGSNLNNPIQQVQSAINLLQQLPQSELMKSSSLYWSDSLLPGQAHYCNAVVMVTTALNPFILLRELQAIENSLGRLRTERWGPRIIDLDILLYGQQKITSQHLTIPHIELLNRNFWLLPLAELEPRLIIPTINKSVKDLSISSQGLIMIPQ